MADCPHAWEDVKSKNGKVYGRHCPRCGEDRFVVETKKRKRHNKKDQPSLFPEGK